jgi:hypothetical protein
MLPFGSPFWYTESMKKSIKVHQKRIGRPATGRDPAVTVRLPETVLGDVETWAAKQEGDLNRSQAIRRLVELGLKGKAEVSVAKPGRHAQPDPVQAAADRAAARSKERKP